MLPDGAIFCGECGRSVNVSASRRPAPAAPVDETPPPPLRQPEQHGRHPDPATEAWLPEATLDPATRAWLTGEDRQPGTVPVDRRSAVVPAPEPFPERTPGRPDLGTQSPDAAAGTVEPPLDPAAYPSDDEERARGAGTAEPADAEPADAEPEDADRTHTTPAATHRPADDPAVAEAQPTAPVWAPAVQQPPAPSRPSWWIGRGTAAPEPPVAETPVGASDEDRPQPGDTAVVEPLVERRAPSPLVAPGSGPSTCPVCGHVLEPDDIFCAECGAVRPTVTAAFTGPVVPLPMARPDWAAEHEPVADPDRTPAPDGASAVEPSDEPGASGPLPATPDEQHQDERQQDADQQDADQQDADDHEADRQDADHQGERHLDADHLDADHAPVPSSAADDPADQLAPVVPPAPAVGTAGVEGSPWTPSRPSGVHAAPDEATAPVSPTVPSASASALTSSAASIPAAAPLPPLPGATGPVLPVVGAATVPSSADDASGAEDEPGAEDVEETRIVDRNTSTAPFVLHFSTGERAAVQGTGLLGRLPRPQPGERFDDLLTVRDPGKSVSKTHLELGRDGDDLWVADRFSGNGTVVRHIDGSIRRCEPGRRYRVERGARVDIGEQFFLVQ